MGVFVWVCVNNSKFFLLAYHENVQKHIDDLFETVFNVMTTQLYSHIEMPRQFQL